MLNALAAAHPPLIVAPGCPCPSARGLRSDPYSIASNAPATGACASVA
jgi:hypothetical protein